jgi:1-acyl-sn-glycerol-3-phosphate acyltransferase
MIGFLLGLFAFCCYAIMTGFLAIMFLLATVVWLVMPVPGWRRAIAKFMFNFPSYWRHGLDALQSRLTTTQWRVVGAEHFSKQQSYLLIANHQSYLDILVLQIIFDKICPQLRYFMKKQLIYIPLIGLGCWILGYPFMQRTKRGNKDLQTTQKTCQRFRNQPVTLVNFVEGTRYRPEKAERSHYHHLLNPKAGGASLVLSAMDDQIKTVINVTIIYAVNKNITWQFLRNGLKTITVIIEPIEVTSNMIGDYQNDLTYKKSFQQWLNQLWSNKDRLIAKTIGSLT